MPYHHTLPYPPPPSYLPDAIYEWSLNMMYKKGAIKNLLVANDLHAGQSTAWDSFQLEVVIQGQTPVWFEEHPKLQLTGKEVLKRWWKSEN